MTILDRLASLILRGVEVLQGDHGPDIGVDAEVIVYGPYSRCPAAILTTEGILPGGPGSNDRAYLRADG